MKTTIDSAGRVVIPKDVRVEAGLTPGTELEVRVVDGVVEIEATSRPVRMVWKDGFLVAERVEPGPPVTEEEVRQTVARLRDRSLPRGEARSVRRKQSRKT